MEKIPVHLKDEALTRHIITGAKHHAQRQQLRADKHEKDVVFLKQCLEQARIRAKRDRDRIKELEAKLKEAGI
jgi:hypothetical protein